MTIFSGRLNFFGWHIQPWTLKTEEGEIDLWPLFDAFFTRSKGVRASFEGEVDSFMLRVDENSNSLLEYHNAMVGLVKETGWSNVTYFIELKLMALNGRMVIIEVDEDNINMKPEPTEQVFGVYFSVGNMCLIPEDKVQDICKPEQEKESCAFLSATGDGYMCQKFDTVMAGLILQRLSQGNSGRIGNCAILGRITDVELERKAFERLLGEEVVIIEEHKDYSGTIRKVGDKARVYEGNTYGAESENEVPLVFEGEMCSHGTRVDYFEKKQ